MNAELASANCGTWVSAFIAFIAQEGSTLGTLGSRVRSMHNLRSIGCTLLLYAQDHDGRLPATLAELDGDYLPSGDLAELGFTSPVTKVRYEWLYFPQPKLDSLPEDTILAASPMTFPAFHMPQARIVVHADGDAMVVSEADYQKRIAEQMVQRPAD